MFSLFLILTGCSDKTVAPAFNEKLGLSGNDKEPMGAWIFKTLAGKSFSKNKIDDNQQPFDKWYFNAYEDEDGVKNVYLLVTPRLLTYEKEARSMASFAETGNTLFVAANYFDPYFLQQFSVSLQDNILVLSSQDGFRMRDTKKFLADTSIFEPSSFSYYFYPMHKSFLIDSSKEIEVLGYNDYGLPDLIRMHYGKGEIILMTNVQACTNYFLLSKNNMSYALGALSYLPPNAGNIYWDDFYRRYYSRPPEGKSIFSALLSIPALRNTFYILLVMAALWIITNLPRKQRVIPVQKPNINSSIEFTQTIARLYYNRKDNHNIALKMIAYLQEYVRNKYYINYAAINDDFAKVLAAKTGLPPEKLHPLVDSIYTVQHNSNIDDTTLLQLNYQIQEVMNIETNGKAVS
jgi:hypothetical protein